MKITHASQSKIEQVNDFDAMTEAYKGCLFFAHDGNTYNMAGECNYQYSLNVENVIHVSDLFFNHSHEDVLIADLLDDLRIDLALECDLEEMSNILDGTRDVTDYNTRNDDEAVWIVQQYQGILAHKLGYDCAESEDEQGTVYIAYCVDRELQEVVC